MRLKRLRLHFTGTVQGVGFRPHIYHLATEMKLSGFVLNRPDGVLVEIEGPAEKLDRFVYKIKATLPPAAAIKTLARTEISPVNNCQDNLPFIIRESPTAGRREFTIGVDNATCSACLAELNDPADRRFAYPFINCTACGPRLTIVNDLPYDRQRTAMAVFPLCQACLAEYNDPASRRFHAEATACPQCGPRLYLCDSRGKKIVDSEALELTRKLLAEGKIIAIKGLGGFHLAVAAADHSAVMRLRQRKNRDAKPLALMVKDLEAAAELVKLNPAEEKLLQTPARPIVLLEKKSSNCKLSSAVAGGLQHYGIMLPYTPLHHLLFAAGLGPLVLTSANLSDEPICIDNQEALSRLNGIADYFLLHNRDIVVRLDDSVAMVVNKRPQLLRRSRGYVPQSIALAKPLPAVLALGGHLKNSLCLIKNDKAWCSPHIGDLETPKARDFFQENIALLQKIGDCQPKIIACDLHPGYYSSRFAANFKGKTVIRVQHHHAHIVSAMVDNRILGPVLGLALDGTGYGSDGHIWGGEFLRVDESGFTRLGQIRYFPLPGGEKAIREPWRIGLSLLREADPKEWLEKARRLKLAPSAFSDAELERLLAQTLNRPLTSSMGRFFDGVAAILGFSQTAAYEAQAAIELEALAIAAGEISPSLRLLPFSIENEAGPEGLDYLELNLLPMITELVQLILNNHQRGDLAALFHYSLIYALMSTAEKLCERHRLERVVLSGGCFQNRLLLAGCRNWPQKSAAGQKINPDLPSLKIFSHNQVPTNDGGLALGQALIAARQSRQKCQ